MARYLLGEPSALLDSMMVEDAPQSGADISTLAHVRFGSVSATLRHSSLRPGFNVEATLTKGSFSTFNYLFPFVYHYLHVRPANSSSRVEKWYTATAAEPAESSFTWQLRNFAAAVAQQQERGGDAAAVLDAVSAASAVANMELLDSIYERAGLGRRGGLRPPE